ncbi:MAG: hypothetical protein R2709_09415 [Marmoricola sp.]
MSSLSDRLNQARGQQEPTAPQQPTAPDSEPAPKPVQPMRTEPRANAGVKERVHQALIDFFGPAVV